MLITLILNDHGSSFVDFLRENNHMTNHHKNIRILLIEIFKTRRNLASPIMESMFNASQTVTA